MAAYPAADWKIQDRPRVTALPHRQRHVFHKTILWLSRRKLAARTNLVVIEVLLRMGILCPLYLLWMSELLFKGRIPRADKERIVLRTVWRTGCLYEWTHHVHLARKAGVTNAEIELIGTETVSGALPIRTQVLLQTVDELLATRTLAAASFHRLRTQLDEEQCVEFLTLSGHYQMISMLINAAGIPVEREYALGALPPVRNGVETPICSTLGHQRVPS